jgi:hypothetical protein
MLMKKNGDNLLTWDEMLRVEDHHPFSAGNLQSLRMGGFRTRCQHGQPRAKPSKAKHSPVADLRRTQGSR